jgi:predicted RND superfamily exporter protein
MTSSSSTSCAESFGTKVEGGIAAVFSRIGSFAGHKPKKTIAYAVGLTVLCGSGFVRWETENRGEELWVPQDTTAEQETIMYEGYFESTSRFNSIIVQSSASDEEGNGKTNVLEKESLLAAMRLHQEIETKTSSVDGEDYDLLALCVKAGGSCVSGFEGICQCLVTSILRQWNYNLTTLENDDNYMETLNAYGKEDLQAILGGVVFDDDENVVSAQAFYLSYFLQDRSEVANGSEEDPINEGWEQDVFLDTLLEADQNYPALSLDYFAARSFGDEFGGAISGDLVLVQISYVVAFLFLGATMGQIKCGTGSRWTMALAALVMIGLSTAAGFGLSSAFGLFFGPVHSLLPFILLGVGVDDAFVIVNAFNRERRKGTKRTSETNEDLAQRSSRALARAGASITVTSLTDLVAFAISSSSALPALASFCAYASISIFFLWVFASTFFVGTMVLDERRQRDNRRECLCCLTRKISIDEEKDNGFEEDLISRYFRNYHAPAILSKVGKLFTLIIFSGLFGFGIYGTLNLSVEDSERSFIPADSYLNDYFDAADEYFPSQGIDVYFTFEGGKSQAISIYEARQGLADLDTRLTGLSDKSPFIAEPVSEEAYRNVMRGMYTYLITSGSGAIGNATLGDDNWPANEADFVSSLSLYTSVNGPGSVYAQDVSFSSDDNGDITQVDAIRVQSEYVRLTKLVRSEIIDDADRQIEAMDDTRALVESWGPDLPPAFPYSPKFITIEGFKILKRELFQNVGLAILAVGIIVLCTVASPVTAFLITINVAFCIVEILGCMFALGIVIDSVSVINIVLAVGLSVDYSAHVGHCFMVKGGTDKNRRALEALADIGAAVLSGAISTFLAVVVLLFSSSYVFVTLSRQFVLTVFLGVIHGLVLLPVLLSLVGPAPFASAVDPDSTETATLGKAGGEYLDDVDPQKGTKSEVATTEHLQVTEHNQPAENSSREDVNGVEQELEK